MGYNPFSNRQARQQHLRQRPSATAETSSSRWPLPQGLHTKCSPKQLALMPSQFTATDLGFFAPCAFKLCQIFSGRTPPPVFCVSRVFPPESFPCLCKNRKSLLCPPSLPKPSKLRPSQRSSQRVLRPAAKQRQRAPWLKNRQSPPYPLKQQRQKPNR